MDADNGSLRDLAATNGLISSIDASKFFYKDKSNFGNFFHHSDALGLTMQRGVQLLIAIYTDQDGDLGLMQTCVEDPMTVLDNQLSDNKHFLLVKPHRAGPLNRPLGALVEVEDRQSHANRHNSRRH